MSVELKNVSAADKSIVEHLFQYYLYDMSEFSGWPLSDAGTFTYPSDLLPPYWENPNHHPYFIVSEGEIAGFALVRRSPKNDHVWDMGQFFVLRKFRGLGLGREAFSQALQMHQGDWQVRVLPNNQAAHRFWKTSISDVSNGAYCEAMKEYVGLNMIFFSFHTGI